MRGINVGGKNKIPMTELRLFLEEQGFANVRTYIQSGNIILRSDLDAKTLSQRIETMLVSKFKLDSPIVKVLALTHAQLQAIVDNKPKNFGEQPEQYHSDVIFMIDVDVTQAISVFNPREGVDEIWPGNGVIYSQRLSSQRTKSRLSKIVGTTAYRSMTIRSWNTTTMLLKILNEANQNKEV